MASPIKDPFTELLTSLPEHDSWWNVDWMRKFIEVLRKDRARAGDGIDELPNENGRFFRVKKQGAGADEFFHPFKVVWRTNPSDPGLFQAAVYQGQLNKSLRPNDKAAITGLTLFGATAANISWFTLLATDKIWLTIGFTSAGAFSYVTLNSTGQGHNFDITKDAWASSNGFCEDDQGTPPTHQTSRILLAYSQPLNGKPNIIQSTSTDLILKNVSIDGRPAIYPVPHAGGHA